MILTEASIGYQGTIVKVDGNDKIRKFLFSLGCYEGQDITLISILAGNYVINIKDSRYAIDKKMAKAIEVTD